MASANRDSLIDAAIAAGNRRRAGDHAAAVAERYNARRQRWRAPLSGAAAAMAMARERIHGLALAGVVVEGDPGVACRRCQTWRSWEQIEASSWAAFARLHVDCNP